MQVVRGSRDGNSIMGPHSLLEDMYGQNTGATGLSTLQKYQQGLRGQINSGGAKYLLNGTLTTPILQFQVNANPTDPTSLTEQTFLYGSDVPPYGYYNGRMMTMLTGPAAERGMRRSSGTITLLRAIRTSFRRCLLMRDSEFG